MIKDYSKVPCTLNITNNREDNVDFDLRFMELEIEAGQTLSLTMKTSEQLALFVNKADELSLDIEIADTENNEEENKDEEKESNVAVIDENTSIADVVADENITEIKLSTDINITEAIKPTHDLVIDGNGKTITSTKRIANAEGVTVELKNVNVNVTEDTAVRASKGGKVIIGSDAKITNTKGWGVTAFEEGTTVEINGTIETGSEPCIAGNGSAGKGNTNIVINEGAKLVSDDITIFIPQDGTVTINGGEIVGKTAIGIKSGTLNINGGTLTATGDKVETLKANSNGMAAWGDTIAIEVNKAYAGGKTDKNIKVNIAEEAVLTSANANIIREYNPMTNITAEVTGAYPVRTEAGKNTFVYTK